MSKTANIIFVWAGVLVGLLFFRWFLIPLTLWMFIASLLLYTWRKLHTKKGIILLWYTGVLIAVGSWLWRWWSELLESFGQVVSSTQWSLQQIVQSIQNRTAIPFEISDWSLIEQTRRFVSWVSFTSLWSSVWGLVLDIVLVIVYSYLFVLYEDTIIKTLKRFSHRAEDYWKLWIKKNAQYIGSLLVIVCVLTVLYSIILLMLWVPFAIMIAILAALGTLIPTVWTALGIIWASIATYALTQSVTTALIVLVLFEIVQIVEEYAILPAIAWKKLAINPMATIILIVLWWVLRWIAWVFLALPIASIIQSILKSIHKNHRFIAFSEK